ncbi:MAG: hypothetical protein KF789_06575 [Bdellovibrionaceae bacterium]|nr:hypothetical protein [Pseudobdellovibrionaceae bacterium]
MNLVYFTEGWGLLDADLRTQCLRLPEVLTEIRRLQETLPGTELLNTVPFREEFDAFSMDLKVQVIEAIQKGLADRIFQRGLTFDGILRRRDFSGPAAVATDIRWRLAQAERIRVEVVGPGFDEIPRLLQDDRIEFVDSIAADPALSWFWDEFKKAANA